MKYKVFCLKDSKIIKIINIITFFLIFISIFGIMIDYFFMIISVILMVLFIVKIILNFKNKESAKLYIKLPIAIDEDNNIYLFHDKLSNIFTILMLIMLIILGTISSNIIEYFVVIVISTIYALTDFIDSCNKEYLKKYSDNLYNLITSKNLRFKIIKIEKISKKSNNSYLLTFDNGNSREFYFSKDYENYDSLISEIEKIIKN